MRQGRCGHLGCPQLDSSWRRFMNSIWFKAQNTSIMSPFMLHDFTFELYYEKFSLVLDLFDTIAFP